MNSKTGSSQMAAAQGMSPEARTNLAAAKADRWIRVAADPSLSPAAAQAARNLATVVGVRAETPAASERGDGANKRGSDSGGANGHTPAAIASAEASHTVGKVAGENRIENDAAGRMSPS
jgi:hypothetical protein